MEGERKCPNCGDIFTGATCPSCGYTYLEERYHLAMVQDGEVCVPSCELVFCIKKEDGGDTHFCPHLDHFRPVQGGYMVTCNPIFKGFVEQ